MHIAHSAFKPLNALMSKASVSGVLQAAFTPSASASSASSAANRHQQKKPSVASQVHAQRLHEQSEAAKRAKQARAEAYLIRMLSQPGDSPPPHQQHPPQPTSRGAMLGIDRMCPAKWIKNRDA